MERKKLFVLILLTVLLGSTLFSYVGTIGTRIQARVLISICGQLMPLPNHTTPFASAKGDLLFIFKEGTTLGEFMNHGGTIFNSSCIYEYCTGQNLCPDPEPDELKFWVNGQRNYEYERYVVKNGDQIVIDYSSGAPKLPGVVIIRK